MKSWRAKNTYQNINARYLTLLCGGVALWSTTIRTRFSDATPVTFSVKCFNPLKLSSVRKHLQKVVCFILFYLFTSI